MGKKQEIIARAISDEALTRLESDIQTNDTSKA